MPIAVKTIEKAFHQFAIGKMRMPSKVYLDLPEYGGDFRAMPAYSATDHMASVKWVNSHPGNARKGIPSVMASIILNDAKTALPLAIMDATRLTGIRTGAAGGVAAKYLSSKNASIAAFVGAGTQARFQAEALLTVRKIKEIRFYDPSKRSQNEFQTWLSSIFEGKIIQCADAGSCVKNAHIITTTTPGKGPVISLKDVSPGTHINAIGADAPGKQELNPDILKKSRIIIDETEQATHSGEINVPIAKRIIKPSSIAGTLGSVISGDCRGRTSDGEITLFDSTGLAIQDLASATSVYRKAKKEGAGKEFAFF